MISWFVNHFEDILIILMTIIALLVSWRIAMNMIDDYLLEEANRKAGIKDDELVIDLTK